MENSTKWKKNSCDAIVTNDKRSTGALIIGIDYSPLISHLNTNCPWRTLYTYICMCVYMIHYEMYIIQYNAINFATHTYTHTLTIEL